jgi:hypothetical protein
MGGTRRGRTVDMALSDQLNTLAVRAKALEDHAAAAQKKSKSDLEKDVKNARDAAQAQGDALRKSAETRKDRMSSWWENLQRDWNKHLAAVRKSVDDKRAASDVKAAQKTADRADADAGFAIDYAYAAIEEAEYAVLDAELAHMEVTELTNA